MSKNILEISSRYVESKIIMTKCQQKMFKQLCHYCKKYVGCKVYGEYFDAWVELESFVRRKYENKNIVRDQQLEF